MLLGHDNDFDGFINMGTVDPLGVIVELLALHPFSESTSTMIDEDDKIIVAVLVLVDKVGELEVPPITLITKLIDPEVDSPIAIIHLFDTV